MVTFSGFRCDLEWAITIKASVIRKLTELMKRVDEHTENFNKELGNRKKSPSELKSKITKMKSTIENLF